MPESARPSGTAARAAPPPPDDGGAKKTPILAWVAGGVGVAGLAVGSVFGVMTLEKRDDIGDHCTGARCDATGARLHDDAQHLALVSTIGFAVGVVGLATSAVLFMMTPKAEGGVRARATASSAGPRVEPFVGPRALGLQGAF
jgi:hypothetical protein